MGVSTWRARLWIERYPYRLSTSGLVSAGGHLLLGMEQILDL